LNSHRKFEEIQYLGFNTYGTLRRLVLSLLCFGLYWWKNSNEKNGDLFFLLGVIILVISAIMLFIKHIIITVEADQLILRSYWSGKIVAINLDDITNAQESNYSKYHFNNPVFNLHLKDTIRFYTGGNQAITLTTKNNSVYRINTAKPKELLLAIKLN
jgi:hypothetical protein